MLPYWLLLSYFAFGALLARNPNDAQFRKLSPALLFGLLLIAAMIGFRYRVGADWNAYVAMYRIAGFVDLDRLLGYGDPGYELLNYLVRRGGLPSWCVNLVCGVTFTWGLYRLARIQPEPWLAILVAIPYLVIVVAMGFARQGVAIGILMAGLASLIRTGSMFRYVFYVAVASLLHRTALVGLVLVGFGPSRGRLWSILFVLLAAGALYVSLLRSHVDTFVQNYIHARYSASGAMIRVLMSVVPAAIFLLTSRRLIFSLTEWRIWRNFSLAALALLALLFIIPSSTAVDRLALYVLPLQMAVLGRMPSLLKSEVAGRAAVAAYAGIVFFVWINYAVNAQAWVPYHSYLRLPLIGR